MKYLIAIALGVSMSSLHAHDADFPIVQMMKDKKAKKDCSSNDGESQKASCGDKEKAEGDEANSDGTET